VIKFRAHLDHTKLVRGEDFFDREGLRGHSVAALPRSHAQRISSSGQARR